MSSLRCLTLLAIATCAASSSFAVQRDLPQAADSPQDRIERAIGRALDATERDALRAGLEGRMGFAPPQRRDGTLLANAGAEPAMPSRLENYFCLGGEVAILAFLSAHGSVCVSPFSGKAISVRALPGGIALRHRGGEWHHLVLAGGPQWIVARLHGDATVSGQYQGYQFGAARGLVGGIGGLFARSGQGFEPGELQREFDSMPADLYASLGAHFITAALRLVNLSADHLTVVGWRFGAEFYLQIFPMTVSELGQLW